ncbi:MAG: hypothetical protein ABJI96_19735 [Paracoccaceae bacterium]
MKRLIAILPLLMMNAPAAVAEEEGQSLMERGAQLFMEGILKEMEPTLDEFQGFADDIGPALRGFAENMGPALTDLLAKVEDWSVYHPPEILPNGDIILRKRQQPEEIPVEPDQSIDI